MEFSLPEIESGYGEGLMDLPYRLGAGVYIAAGNGLADMGLRRVADI